MRFAGQARSFPLGLGLQQKSQFFPAPCLLMGSCCWSIPRGWSSKAAVHGHNSLHEYTPCKPGCWDSAWRCFVQASSKNKAKHKNSSLGMINYQWKRQGTKAPGYQWLNQSVSSPHLKISQLHFCLEGRAGRNPQQLLMGSKDFSTQCTSFNPSLSAGLHCPLGLAEMISEPLAGPAKADPYS